MIRVAVLLASLSVGALAHAGNYATDIKPLLRERCLACHGALKQEGGLRLDTGASARAGGDSGAAIEAGKPDESLLVQRISDPDPATRMPPEGEPLTAEQIAAIRTWIEAGATSPSDEQPEADPREHWAFRPPVRPQLPITREADWSLNPIDAFIGAKHEHQRLQSSSIAAPEVLLRRLWLDLAGLPPSREELHAWLADPSDAAWQQTVDRLLERPQHGERWARHWMDVWRYSDWYGRRYVNDVRNSYPNVWHWRDWIVRSLNADKGYDRMVIEMLAADEIAPEDDDTIAATGFIVRNWYSLNYDQWMSDLVEHTGKAFLGLRLNCAMCHDHKYDPISQKEYFQFRAFFEPLELRQDRVPGGAALPKFVQYVAGSNASNGPIDACLPRVFDENLDAETYMFRMADARLRIEGEPPVSSAAPAILGGDKLEIESIHLPAAAWYPGLKEFVVRDEKARCEKAIADANTSLQATQTRLAELMGRAEPAPENELKVAQLDVAAAESQRAAAEAELTAVAARIEADDVRYRGASGNADESARAASQAERTLAVANGRRDVAVAETAVAKAADADAKTKAEQQLAAGRTALQTAESNAANVSAEYTPLSPTYPTKSTGRRTALARWLTGRENPLTARVAINHIWMRHFGRPLVESVVDFGRSGAAPTHPELLDWLAVELMESGWSMKHIHRLIVTSRAYRMRSEVEPACEANLAIDADNRSLWRFPAHRAEGEVIRDAMLACTGELDLSLGGKEIDVQAEATSKRRSIYFSIHPEDGGHMPFSNAFDAPDPLGCYRRTETVVPQQALAMANSQLILNCSRRLAATLAAAVPSDREEQLTAAFEIILSRAPTDEERQACHEFLTRQATLLSGSTEPPAASVDGQTAPAADAQQRALEGLVRALFSHNDFVTIH